MVNAKLLVLGDESLVTGFRLAGVENTIQTSNEHFQKNLETALENKEFGIIVVNEIMLSKIDWRLRRQIDANPYPIIISIPDISGTKIESEDIILLIKRALGVDLSSK